MSDLSVIVATLREIKYFLRDKITPQLINSLQGASNAIQNVLGNPNLQANLRNVLQQSNTLLESINRDHLVEEISGTVKNLNGILKDIDPNAISEIVQSVKNLLDEANKADMIKNISGALDGITCLRDLANVANQLVSPAKLLMYGATGALIGIAITGGIQTYLKNKQDQKLQASIDQLVSINTLQLYVAMHTLRQSAGSFLLNMETARYQNPGITFSEQLTNLEQEDYRLLAMLSPMDIESMELLQKAQEFCNKMLVSLYQPELQNESMADYLDRVGNNNDYLEQLVDFLVYSSEYRLSGSPEKPILPRDELNYHQVTKRFGVTMINSIMTGLANEFATHGGNQLFVGLVNSFDNTTHEFALHAKQIQQKTLDFVFPQSPWSEGANGLLQYYHNQTDNPEDDNAFQYINTQWQNTDWHHQGFTAAPELTNQVFNIIRLRAYLEFCHRTAPYLCFPRNIPREIMNGAIDLPAGIWQLVTHPINSVMGLGGLLTVEGWKNLGYRFYCHPTRILTTQALSVGVSVGANHYLHTASLPPKAPNAGHFIKVVPKTAVPRMIIPKATVPIHPPVPPVPPVHAVPPSTLIQGTVTGTLRAGTMQQQPSDATEAHNTSDHELEMSPLAPPLITSDLTASLIERLVDVRDADSFYAIFTAWYEEITQPIPPMREEKVDWSASYLPPPKGVLAASMSNILNDNNSKNTDIKNDTEEKNYTSLQS